MIVLPIGTKVRAKISHLTAFYSSIRAIVGYRTGEVIDYSVPDGDPIVLYQVRKWRECRVTLRPDWINRFDILK
ncbi:MAG: hypothetical protein P4L87_06775 [Formivibrio sp.]|nr:hypothetical protein [Formivibrio sp.]